MRDMNTSNGRRQVAEEVGNLYIKTFSPYLIEISARQEVKRYTLPKLQSCKSLWKRMASLPTFLQTKNKYFKILIRRSLCTRKRRAKSLLTIGGGEVHFFLF